LADLHDPAVRLSFSQEIRRDHRKVPPRSSAFHDRDRFPAESYGVSVAIMTIGLSGGPPAAGTALVRLRAGTIKAALARAGRPGWI
jgi:hypothetical protein